MEFPKNCKWEFPLYCMFPALTVYGVFINSLVIPKGQMYSIMLKGQEKKICVKIQIITFVRDNEYKITFQYFIANSKTLKRSQTFVY